MISASSPEARPFRLYRIPLAMLHGIDRRSPAPAGPLLATAAQNASPASARASPNLLSVDNTKPISRSLTSSPTPSQSGE